MITLTGLSNHNIRLEIERLKSQIRNLEMILDGQEQMLKQMAEEREHYRYIIDDLSADLERK